MDVVLGLAMTSTDVRWVLVEGTTGEGATIHRDGIDFDTLDDIIAAVGDNRLHAVGVTWTNEAEAEASLVLDALAARDLDNVITISELEAADVLAAGIAGLTEAPVFSAAEADLALARGAALASARAVNTLEAPRAPLMSRTAALASVLVAAVVIFVISLSVALGLSLTPGTEATPEQRPAADAVDAPAPAAPAPSVKQAAPKAPRPAAPPPPSAPPPQAGPPAGRTVPAAVPPAPDVAPADEPPAYVPPAPVYTPPAPAYVPPAPPPNYVPPAPPQPRLRDRIIERIPIINRFHEPQLQYPR
jgi:hypothetical protein